MQIFQRRLGSPPPTTVDIDLMNHGFHNRPLQCLKGASCLLNDEMDRGSFSRRTTLRGKGVSHSNLYGYLEGENGHPHCSAVE